MEIQIGTDAWVSEAEVHLGNKPDPEMGLWKLSDGVV